MTLTDHKSFISEWNAHELQDDDHEKIKIYFTDGGDYSQAHLGG